jgi:hypothetical protein
VLTGGGDDGVVLGVDPMLPELLPPPPPPQPASAASVIATSSAPGARAIS